MKDGSRGTRFRPSKFICINCRDGSCVKCIDLLRSVYTREKVCECPKHKSPSGRADSAANT